MNFLTGLILDQIFDVDVDADSSSIRRLEEADQDKELTHHHIIDAAIVTIAAWLTMVVVSIIYLVSVVAVGSMSISNNITRSFIPIRPCTCRLLK